MKKKLTIALALVLIVASITMNVVLTILLVGAGNKNRHMKQENSKLLAQVISFGTGQTMSWKSKEDFEKKARLYRRDFVSHHDFEPDSYVLSPPVIPPSNNQYTLLVYLHGMGSNYMEPYIMAKKEPIVKSIQESYPGFIFASLSFGKESAWGNEKSVQDINQNISELTHAYPVHNIVLMGSSMGGCVALNYAAIAPAQIRKRITGVVSVESSGDIAKVYTLTKEGVVKLGIMNAMGGSPEQKPDAYRAASLLDHLNEVPRGVKFSIVSARKDKTVPVELQKNLVEELTKNGYENKLFEVDIAHEFPSAATYIEALDFVMQK